MTDDAYGYDRFPKARYACPECDREVVVAGHEYEAVFCCGDTEMDWVKTVYDPMDEPRQEWMP